MRVVALTLLLVSDFALLTAAEPVSLIRRGGDAFVDASNAAATVGFKFEVVQDEHLATFCQTGDRPICIPLGLTDANSFTERGKTYVSLSAVATALSMTVKIEGEQALLTPAPESAVAAVPGYNAEWGRKRGFQEGDVLPDIPLLDMNGNEVRFSSFLGKRYILYCWASW